MNGVRAENGARARFVLVRHGEAEGNRELRYLGTTDAPLTPRGEEQARQVAAALRPYRVTVIYSSPLGRAQTTARAIGDALGREPRADDRLREADYGLWENLTRDEVLARDSDLLRAWESGGASAPPGGESLEAVRDRVLAAVGEWTVAHTGQVVALVSHVGPIKALLCTALGLPLAGARRMWLDPASVCVVDWRIVPGPDASGLVRVVNSVAHLEPAVRWRDAVR